MRVRAYVDGDNDALVALWAEVFADDPPWNAPRLIIPRKLGVQPELLLVALVGEELVGALIAGFDGMRGWLHHLAVDPRWRGQGIGRALVERALNGLRRHGCDKLNLQVRADNHGVVAFYQSLGFEVEPRISMGRRI
ncbi:MAG: GNAT family acetyltransferase [Gammaproteobacteria bacterium]|nr:GNAT family acetyltransferase [Gammaproteobacteria bacterium]